MERNFDGWNFEVRIRWKLSKKINFNIKLYIKLKQKKSEFFSER